MATTKINLGEKCENNILKKFGNGSFESSSDLSKKEKLMWTFALYLLKDRWMKKIFDLEDDRAFLINYLAILWAMIGGFPYLGRTGKLPFVQMV